MPLYFLDTRDGDDFVEDEVGLELRGLEEAKVEGAKTLAEIPRDVIPGSDRRVLIVEVREDRRPVLEARLTFEALILAK